MQEPTRRITVSPDTPLISIITVNWNGKRWLSRFLTSLQLQTYKNIEIILVDNASSDESVVFVKDNYPDIRVVESKTNLGFAGGVKLGIQNAKGKYILISNNDAWLESNCVERLLKDLLRKQLDVVTPRVVSYDNNPVNGDYIYSIDLLGHPVNMQYRSSVEPFYLSGQCLLFKTDMYLETLGFDDDFFMYMEDADWFWRLQLLGRQFGVSNQAYMHHAGHGSTNAIERLNYYRFFWRNQYKLTMLIKNYSTLVLVIVLPIYMAKNIFEIMVFLLIGKPRIAWTYIYGWSYNLRNIKRTLEKRRWVQSHRKRSDFFIMQKMYIGIGEIRHLMGQVEHSRGEEPKHVHSKEGTMEKNSKPQIAVVMGDSFDHPELSALPRYVFEVSQRLKNKYEFSIFSRGAANKKYIVHGLSIYEFSSNPVNFFHKVGGIIAERGISTVHFYGDILGANLLVRSFKQANASIVINIYGARSNFHDMTNLRVRDLAREFFRITAHSSFVSMILPRFWLRRALIDDRVKSVITPSARLERKLVSLAGGEFRIIQVPHGVDYPRFSVSAKGARKNLRQQYGISSQDIVVLYTGRAGLVRGLDDIIWSVSQAMKELPNLYCFFLLAQSGSNAGIWTINYIADLAKGLLPTNRFHLYDGYVKSVVDYYLFSDIVVLPYRYVSDIPEYPLVLLEAMAAGKAVITTKIGAIPELVKDGNNGILVNPKDRKALADVFLDLGRNKDKAVRLGMNAKKSMRSLDWDIMVSRIDEIYKEAIKEKPIATSFDKFSSEYDDTAFKQSLGVAYLSKIETSFLNTHIETRPGESALSIGVGTGRDATILAKKGARVISIDVSSGMIEKAKSKLTDCKCEFLIADAGKRLPFNDNVFDAITCMQVLKYIPTWRFTITEVARVIKPGGSFLLEISNRRSISAFGSRGVNYNLFSQREIEETLENNGFKIINIKGGSRLPFHLYKVIDNRALLVSVKAVERIIDWPFPGCVFCRNIMFFCQKT